MPQMRNCIKRDTKFVCYARKFCCIIQTFLDRLHCTFPQLSLRFRIIPSTSITQAVGFPVKSLQSFESPTCHLNDQTTMHQQNQHQQIQQQPSHPLSHQMSEPEDIKDVHEQVAAAEAAVAAMGQNASAASATGNDVATTETSSMETESANEPEDQKMMVDAAMTKVRTVKTSFNAHAISRINPQVPLEKDLSDFKTSSQ